MYSLIIKNSFDSEQSLVSGIGTKIVAFAHKRDVPAEECERRHRNAVVFMLHRIVDRDWTAGCWPNWRRLKGCEARAFFKSQPLPLRIANPYAGQSRGRTRHGRLVHA